ncbi:MAG: hypothetical protein JWM65_3533 [Sphingomonas bacterium]|nr:hypothetical protein [Sphingomonas bacterium]
MNPLVRPWRQVFDFSGRATRTEYGLFHITAVIAFFAMSFLSGITQALLGRPGTESAATIVSMAIVTILALVSLLGFLAALIGHISIAIRRLHDHGDPGIKYLLTFIPFIGFIFYLMLVFARGDDYENDYGPDPRLGEQESTETLGSVFS